MQKSEAKEIIRDNKKRWEEALQENNSLHTFSLIVDLIKDVVGLYAVTTAGMSFWTDAYIASSFGHFNSVDRMRLSSDEFPDFITMKGLDVRSYEITEAMELGRLRNYELEQQEIRHVDEFHSSEYVLKRISEAALGKCNPKYKDAGVTGLVIYLNVGFIGGDNEADTEAEIIYGMPEATSKAKDFFDEIWIFWKSKWFCIWPAQ